MLSNQIFYKVLNERTIIVATDNTAKRQQYEEQVIKTFFVSHADAVELAQLVNTVILAPQMAIQPRIAPNKTANTLTVRAAAPVMEIIEQVIKINDKPRAEVIVDVQILEVSRERAKRFGLNLTDYAIGGIFSPEQAPGGSSTSTGTGGTTTTSTGGATAPSNVGSPPVFNANTISTGVSAADFYLAVPAAIVRFLESDSQTKTVAKPQLRGTEGQKITLNLGEEVPVPSTTFTPLAQGGANANPLTSFTYRPIGVIVEMTARVTYEGDIVMDLTLENSARGQDSTIAGQSLPAFASRKVTTRLRLRDGESNLLAGLLREDERRSLRGFPGILRLPLLQQLFADNDTNIRQTDIVMLLTPRIIRSHQLTTSDLSPIYIGTQANMAVGGPPPVFGGADVAPPPAASPSAEQPLAPVAGTTPPAPAGQQIPAGSSPTPGFTAAPGAAQPVPARPRSQRFQRRILRPPPPQWLCRRRRRRVRSRRRSTRSRRRPLRHRPWCWSARRALISASAAGHTSCRSRSRTLRACRRCRSRCRSIPRCCVCARCRRANSCGRAACRPPSRRRSMPPPVGSTLPWCGRAMCSVPRAPAWSGPCFSRPWHPAPRRCRSRVSARWRAAARRRSSSSR